MIKKHLILVLLLWLANGLFAQEYLSGLHSNPLMSANKDHAFTLKTTGEVHLPFLDDFSYRGQIYPADTLWADRDVFINSTYAINPPTVGVATLDAINDTGAIYPSATPTPFLADNLTSLPIRLDSMFDGSGTIDVSDSVYFSFYYQPQGVADAPSPGDSLMLDFYSPNLDKWYPVWGSGGLTLDSFRTVYNRDFKQVMIAITDTTFLQKGFRFRFSNYASIAPLTIPSWQSNVDEWNIDYVYLNIGRNKADTLPQDIAFVDPAPTILKNFTRIPSRHYTNAYLTANMVLKESNLFNISTNMSYKYVVTEENGPFTYTKSGGVFDIFPFLTNGYHTYPLHANPVVDFSLPAFGSNDSVAFNITHIMSSNGFTDKNRRNDTIVHRQEFLNSYAYDDGTAENGYGLSGASAKLAYEFTINQPDTLGGVEMYFNETLSTPYYKYFYLMVWSSLDPETLVYKSKRLRPEFADSINAFYTYQIEDTSILVSGKFYIGWQQLTDDNLNVGFDRNTNAKTHTFFNVDGTWTASSFDGSLMMRPMTGTSWQIKKTNGRPSVSEFACFVYPNPANGNKIYIDLPANYNTQDNKKNITLEIFDYLGRNVYKNVFSNELDIQFLSKGIYYLRFFNYHTNEVAVNKLVITR
jgi:hypothetical protein